ncbi:MAG TPA: cation:proton antiporter [Polyangiaceae bacterium]|nr:cation:proton antiporter [Polyangiaceae bacterium]
MLSAFPLLILQTCVIIVAARLIGALARRLGQPSVIAEVIAGILLGPSLFGRVSPGAFQDLFPKASMPGLSLLSQVGLVFFMFLIGLELDPKLLRGRGKSSFAISAAGICVPFGLGALLALRIFGTQAEAGVPKISFVLFMGIAMSITAFPVLARILAERNLIRTKLGSIALACAAADDVTAWCLLALVVSVVHANGAGAALITTLEALAFAGGMLLVVRPLLARLGARITTRENLTQNVVAFTFVLLLVSALTSELIGIHALFGAFLFGTIMPRHGDYAHALAERLEDFVVVALLPLFFAYSGLRTELGLLASGSDWALCGGLIAVACIGKFGGTFCVARLTGMNTRDSAALGVLMNTRGLMELIVLNVGLDLGVISPKIFTMMVIMALVTTIMTTPLLELVAPRSFEVQKPASVDPVQSAPVRLLLCVGDAQMGPAMVLLAVSCAGGSRDSGSAVLHLERPRDRTSAYLRPGSKAVPQSRASGLLPALEAATAAGVALEFVSFDSSDPAADICEVARSKHSDYVVLGLHRPVLGQNPFGGTVGKVLADSPAPVALLVERGLARAFAGAGGQSLGKRVVMPVCGSIADAVALNFAERLLCDEAVSLNLVFVEPLLAVAGELVRARVERLCAQHPERVQYRTSQGGAGPQRLRDCAAEADLVVLGLDPVWGLDVERGSSESARLLAEFPSSLVILDARSA